MIPKDTLFQLAKALDGLLVLGCLEGTPAAFAGVRYGDILMSVNGERVRTVADYVAAKELRADGMSVVLYRSGEEHPVAFDYDANRQSVNPVALLAELVSMRVHPGEVEGDGAPS